MLTEQSAPSSSSSTTSTSSVASLGEDSPPSHNSVLEPLLGRRSASPPPADNGVQPRQPLDVPLYATHDVGLGLALPRRGRGLFSPHSRESLESAQARMSPTSRTTHAESSNQPASADGSDLYQVQPAAFMDHLESIPPPSPSLANAEARHTHATFSPHSPIDMGPRSSSPGPSGPGLHIDMPQQHHPGNPFVPSGPALSPPAPGMTSSGQQPDALQSPAHGSPTSLDLGQELTLPSANPADSTLNMDFTEFDFEGLSTLEKIYLFSRSRAGFQRVYIAHALPDFLQHRRDHSTDTISADGQHQEVVGDEEITPAEAVEYVLPLLNGLAMDEGASLFSLMPWDAL